ncbi:hypothetical protein IPZ58_07575 [Streptomyces roseoverticillatus]|uniref:hypothetical protein n=1 Tax=Streptomyces roseoverticillatus TaxID=66429 RepID=UPI001F20E9C1|nr:hypothetical protein [Streptomyces roseoverticillatus]MCF3101439.1 hypothetical protein [Streptomyces roseoverticillatus]
MSEPITPTRIIPAGQPLPPTAPPMPAAPPGTQNLPPWRRPAAPPPPPPIQPPSRGMPWPEPPPPGPLEVRVVVDLVHPEPTPEPPGPRFRWAWLWPHIRPFQTVLGGVLALVQMPWGYSIATTWAYTVHEARGFGAGWAYDLGLGAFALTALAEVSGVRHGVSLRRQFATRTALVITFIGAIGAIDLYDPVTALTGVHHR